MQVYCPECEHGCSESATNCPQCGHPLTHPLARPLGMHPLSPTHQPRRHSNRAPWFLAAISFSAAIVLAYQASKAHVEKEKLARELALLKAVNVAQPVEKISLERREARAELMCKSFLESAIQEGGGPYLGGGLTTILANAVRARDEGMSRSQYEAVDETCKWAKVYSGIPGGYSGKYSGRETQFLSECEPCAKAVRDLVWGE